MDATHTSVQAGIVCTQAVFCEAGEGGGEREGGEREERREGGMITCAALGTNIIHKELCYSFDWSSHYRFFKRRCCVALGHVPAERLLQTGSAESELQSAQRKESAWIPQRSLWLQGFTAHSDKTEGHTHTHTNEHKHKHRKIIHAHTHTYKLTTYM